MFDGPVIDVLDFTESESLVSGTVSATKLPRLQDHLATESGEVFYSIEGRIDGDGNPRLTISIGGTLSILCLRCLGPVAWTIATRRELRCLPHPSFLPEVADEAPEVDDIVMPGQIRILDWVEEEILLGLPMSPQHNADACSLPLNPASEPSASVSPFFAALAGLNSPRTNDQ